MTAIPESRIDIINRQAVDFGWKIIRNPNFGTLLRTYVVVGTIESVPDAYKMAWETCVGMAWNEHPVAMLGLDFIREHSPEEYVDMIYHAHGVTQGRSSRDG